jgi:plastocyanin
MPKLSALILAVGMVALAGCGNSSSNSTSSSTSTPTASSSTAPAASSQAPSGSLNLAANPEGQLKYNTTSLTAQAGKVSIDFTNTSPLGHNVTIEATGGKIIAATPTFQGGSKTLTANLKPGTYKFFCSVPGHRMAGMEGTLTVK